MPHLLPDCHANLPHSLSNLLTAVEYNPRKDTIFMSGDILAKSTEAGSLAILDFIVRQKQGLCAKGADGASRLSRSSPSDSQGKTPPCKPIYAVRGNHDQMVIQWRAWRDWFEELQITSPPARLRPSQRLPLPSSLSALASSLAGTASYDAGPAVGTGSEFLTLIEAEWLRDRKKDPNGAGSDVEEWIDVARKRAQGTWRAEWWKRIPRPGKGRAKKEWIMFGDHYNIARDMTREHAQFLYSLPLVIHVPSEHFFVAHAGLLPYDPRKASDNKHQPLAHTPSSDEEHQEDDDDYEYPTVDVGPSQQGRLHTGRDDGVDELRVLQEHALLEDIPHNRDPWVILNIRSIRNDGTVTRKSGKGSPWAKVWNGQMKRCAGFIGADVASANASSADPFAFGDKEDPEREKELPCYPSTVVYGHAAGRDLDVRRWTLGLDTGCLYGRRLTALVLTSSQGKHAWGTMRVSPADDDDDGSDDDEEESSDEEEDELDETVLGGTFQGVNSRFARVEGGSAISRSRARAKRPKTWTRTIKFGDKNSDLGAKLVSVKCPKVGDLA
ncbi:hypothetical protein LXA43DRAFT_983265 [Ganoderma leucocontextum]|nr:hypothetical protein LXA43DRAFT_983265 [Ganoderma leucocontextum]